MQNIRQFKKIILDYYKKHGRHDLPWRKIHDPYKILVSEIMLQQTQVGRVIGKYREFIKEFPDFKKLAQASTAKVLKVWSGLGYNRRALYLKRTAERVADEFGGKLPNDPSILVDLPGIGPNTAGAICAYSFNMPVVFIETNIRRVFIHFFFNKTKRKISDAEILKLVEETLDRKNPRAWYSALMDYGTYLKSQVVNPNRRSLHYAKQSKFEGSDRELRGKILKLLLKKKEISKKEIVTETKENPERIEKVLGGLKKDKFIRQKGNRIILAK